MPRRGAVVIAVLLVSIVALTVGVSCGRQAPADVEVEPTAGLEAIQAQLEAGDFEGAEAELTARLEADDTNAELHFQLGLTHFKLGEYELAREAFERSLALDPVRAAAVHHNLGVLAYQTGDLSTALNEFQAALEADPDDADTHYQLGATYLVLAFPLEATLPDPDLIAEAQAEFGRALEIAPGKPEALVGLANAHMLLSDYDRAIPLLEDVLDGSPDMREALFALGNAYAAVGETEKCVATFERFLATNPPAVWAQQAEEILAQIAGE